MDLKPYDRLTGLRDALKQDGNVPYSEIRMASLQRGYEWQKQHWTALFNDTKKEIDREYPINAVNKGPFIGVMILTELPQGLDPNGGEKPYWCEIVDGQQRTTTTFILASIIRDHLSDAKKSLANVAQGFVDNDPRRNQYVLLEAKIEESLVHCREFLSIGPVGSAKPRLISWPFLKDIISSTVYTEGSHVKNEGISSEQKKANAPTKKFADAVSGLRKLMVESKKELRETVSTRQDYSGDEFEWALLQEQVRFLSEFWNALADRMLVVKLSTKNIKDAGEVFLSLNSKGKSLGTKDIVKATLMNIHVSHPAGMHNFSQNWEVMSKQVSNVDQYLRIAWMTSSKVKTQEKNVAVVVSEHLDKNPISHAEKLSNELFDWAPVYQAIIDVDAPQEYRLSEDPFVKTQLLALRQTGVSYRFFLLPHTLQVRAGREGIGTTGEVVGLLRTLSFTWKFVFDLPQKMEDFYFALATDLQSNDDDVVRSVLPKLKSKVEESIQKFKAREMNMLTAKLLLNAFEDAARKKAKQPTVGWDTSDHTVEHTAPQTPTVYWQGMLNPEARESFRYGDVIAQVGNLTLLSKKQNSGIQQWPWNPISDSVDDLNAKKIAYENSMFFTTRELKDIPDWSTGTIESRGRWMKEMIEKLFDPQRGTHMAYVPFPAWLAAES